MELFFEPSRHDSAIKSELGQGFIEMNVGSM